MADEGVESRGRAGASEPVYGPAPGAAGHTTSPMRDRKDPAEAASPPYIAPYPPYLSDGPEPLPLSLSTAAALAYFIVPAVFFLLVPPYRLQPLLRFHSWQAIFYFLLAVALREVELVLASMLPYSLAYLLSSLLLLLLCTGWLVVVVKALQGEPFRLPLVGSFAAQVAQTSSLNR